MKTSSSIIQNLRDAGCDDGLIAKYLDLQAQGRTSGLLHMLACHRSGLLEALHADGKKVDCLDHLIHVLEKETERLVAGKDLQP